MRIALLVLSFAGQACILDNGRFHDQPPPPDNSCGPQHDEPCSDGGPGSGSGSGHDDTGAVVDDTGTSADDSGTTTDEIGMMAKSLNRLRASLQAAMGRLGE